jgi:hypothetical protein
MDNVNTAIRCPHSTLPRNGRVPKKSVKEKEMYRFYRFTKGLIYYGVVVYAVHPFEITKYEDAYRI